MIFTRQNWRQLAALVPAYDEYGGNCTQIWLTDGQVIWDKRKVDTVLKELAGVFAIDLSQLKRNCRANLGRWRNLPLTLHYDLWLVPVFCRRAVDRNDGCMGYVVFQQIETVEEGEATEIVFRHGSRLTVTQAAESIITTMTLTQMAGNMLA